MIIVQIGANRGNDDLTNLIGKTQPDKLILVEPLSIHNEKIQQCYSWVKNLVIDNVAITISNDEKITFYFHEKDGPGYEVGSVDKNHVAKHYGWDTSGIKEVEVNSLTTNNLFKRHKLKKIDILFIDAEGIDDLIIKSIDYSKYDISKIYFENLHLSEKDIYDFLAEKGYKITHKTGTNGWCSLAEK